MLAVLVGMTFSAAPVAAAPVAAPAQPTLAAAARAQVAALPAAALAQAAAAPAQAPAPDAPAGRPFFKTGKGVLAGVLIAGVLGYTVYSFSNDRVKSPIR